MEVTTPAIALLTGILILAWWNPKLRKKSDTKEPLSNQEAEEIQRVFVMTKEAMESEQLYLQKSIKLSDLALQLNQKEKTVSRAINTHGGGNFNAFVNQLRIEHSKELMNSGKFDHYTVEAIAEESGFSNKVSFYQAFKMNTGMSPKEFRALKQP